MSNEPKFNLTYILSDAEHYEDENLTLPSDIYLVSGVQPHQMKGWAKSRLEHDLASQLGVPSCVVSYGLKTTRVFVKTTCL